MRVKRGTSHVKRRRKLLSRTKGYQFGRKKLVRHAKTAVLKAGQHALHDRRKKKGDFRALWNIRINAAVREHGMNYRDFIHALKTHNVELDRKTLSTLAKDMPEVFAKVVLSVKK